MIFKILFNTVDKMIESYPDAKRIIIEEEFQKGRRESLITERAMEAKLAIRQIEKEIEKQQKELEKVSNLPVADEGAGAIRITRDGEHPSIQIRKNLNALYDQYHAYNKFLDDQGGFDDVDEATVQLRSYLDHVNPSLKRGRFPIINPFLKAEDIESNGIAEFLCRNPVIRKKVLEPIVKTDVEITKQIDKTIRKIFNV